jgi:hypothetical protein
MCPKLPPQAKGRKVICAICGWELPERDYRMNKRDGKWICKDDLDTLTDKERNNTKW